MSNTANLVLPFLAVGQAQKHVTVNESLRKLDAIVQLSVVSATTTAQPGSPTDGQVYIVPSGKTGTQWATFANWSLAYYRDGAWAEIAPREGWLAFVRDTDQLLHYTGSAWSLFPAGKILTVSATDKVLGRVTSGAGAAEEIACTAAGRAFLDDPDATTQRTTLGAPGLAVANAFTETNTFDKAAAGAGTDSVVVRNTGATNVGHSGGIRFKFGGAEPCAIRATIQSGVTGESRLGLFTSPDGTGASLTERWGVTPGGVLEPLADNAHSLGTGSLRVSEVFAGTGTINTSDAREKTPLRAFSDAERRAIRRVFASAGMFQWLDALARKGPDPEKGGARLHAGVTAQAVAGAFEAEGLDPARYALFCADALEEEVETEETVRVKRAVLGPEREIIEVVGGKPVLRRVREPLRRLEAVVDETGEAIVRGGKALTFEVEVMEEIEITRPMRVRRPKLDGNGEPVTRMGVRYDQLFAMALATCSGIRPPSRSSSSSSNSSRKNAEADTTTTPRA